METKMLAMKRYGMGWMPDIPDFRDYTPEHKSLKPSLKKMGLADPASVAAKPDIDLRADCSPIEDQRTIGSCTAQAGVGLVEYFERRAFGTHLDASRLFLYKVTRNLLGLTGDTGAYIRTAMGAMALFGVPPERYWPYTDEPPSATDPDKRHFDLEPPAFCYAFAQNYQSLSYFRLDGATRTPREVLTIIKAYLNARLPSMFGFPVFSCIDQAQDDGKIPFPCQSDTFQGGHAVVAVGYSDKLNIRNQVCGLKTKGAFLIRNSWGTGWGDQGYGWLPYEYLLQGGAIDWWTLLKKEYVDVGQFGI
jgi:C1A family cysteine protease